MYCICGHKHIKGDSDGGDGGCGTCACGRFESKPGPNHIHVYVTAETRGLCDTCGEVTRPGVICTTGTCSRRQCDECGAKGYIAVPVPAPRPVRDFDERRDHEQSERAAMQRWKFDGFDPEGRY